MFHRVLPQIYIHKNFSFLKVAPRNFSTNNATSLTPNPKKIPNTDISFARSAFMIRVASILVFHSYYVI